MRNYIFFCLMLISGLLFAGHKTETFYIYFQTDQHNLDRSENEKLEKICDFLKQHPGSSIELTGRTDFDGSDAYNIGLSEKRANEVKMYLTTKGFKNHIVSKKWFGENRPLASNLEEKGKAENRSVEIVIKYLYYNNTAEWLKENAENQKQVFSFNSGKSTKIVSKNKNVIQIPADAFVKENGEKLHPGEKVNVEINEVSSVLEALVNQTYTLSGDQLLETGGMLKMEAFCNNSKLVLAEGKNIKLEIPTPTEKEDMFVFEGYTDKNGNLDWKNTGTAFVNNYSLRKESFKMNENILLAMVKKNKTTKPHLKDHNYKHKIPVFSKMPREPKAPTKPVQPTAKSLFHPFVYIFTTKKMRQKAINREYQKSMVQYEKREANYQKRLAKYNSLLVKYSKEIAAYEEEKRVFYAWLDQSMEELDKEMRCFTEYYDLQRINKGLLYLYNKSLKNKLYDQSPLKSFKTIACASDEHDETFQNLMILSQKKWVLLAARNMDYDQMVKQMSSKGYFDQNRYKYKPFNMTYWMQVYQYNGHLDEFIEDHEGEFTRLFKDDFENHLTLTQRKKKIADEENSRNYFVANTNKLGWINCDRFVKEPMITVETKIIPGAAQMAVLSNIRSMLPVFVDPISSTSKVKLPDKKAFKFVTLSIEGSYAYLSIVEATASRNLTIVPEFKKMPVEEANQLLARL
ncbi:MAG: OmpA family protein [Flavobacteriales bacterium]|nr:OmpA family protein [Flavobacteriales bacterium]